MAGADRRSISGLAGEFELLRRANITLFKSLDEHAWLRTGAANDATTSVRAIPWILAGHAGHHIRVLRERYLGAP